MPLAQREKRLTLDQELSTPEEKEYKKVEEWLMNCENSTPEVTWRDHALEDYRFYAGDQDDEDVKALLQAQNRPNSVFNEVKPKIDMLVGIAAQVKFDGQVVPVGAEDEALAELVNGVLHHYRRKMKLLRKELECFEHMVKSGRSLLYFWVGKSDPFKPELKCRRVPGHQFMVDPESVEYDLSDARYVFVEKWVTEEELKVFDDKIEPEMLQIHGDTDSDRPAFFNENTEKYRVVECWYKKWSKYIYFQNPMTGQVESLPQKEFREFKRMMLEGIQGPDGSPIAHDVQAEAVGYKEDIHYMLFSGQFVIESGRSPYKMEGFPFVLYGAYKDEDNNAWFSAVKMMKDPQRALNTMRRQLVHLLQTLPKGILMHETGAIIDIEEYQENSANPGYHMEVSRGMIDKVKFEKQPQISPLYQQLDEGMRMSMKASSGIQEDLMGEYTASREPGITVQTRQQAGMAVLHMLYENFRESRIIGNKILMKMMQQFVTQPELIRIQGQQGAQLVQINSQINPGVAGFNDITIGEYDLEMDETTSSPSARMAISQLLAEFSHNNPGAIPPDLILEYANVPFTVKQQVRQFWEMQRKIEQENIDADRAVEIMKIEAQAQKAKESKSEKKD